MVRDSRLTRFSPSVVANFPSSCAPFSARETRHSLPFALLGHAATATRHDSLVVPRSCTPLFLPSHAELRTRRSVKRSISFGDHAAPRTRISAIPKTPLLRQARFSFQRFGAKFEAKFPTASSTVFLALPRTESTIFSHRFASDLIKTYNYTWTHLGKMCFALIAFSLKERN